MSRSLRLFFVSFLTLSATFSVRSSFALDLTPSREKAQVYTDCLRNELTAATTRRPSALDLHFGEDWVCTKLLYLNDGTAPGAGFNVVIVPGGGMPTSYRFKESGRVVLNSEGTALGGRRDATEYMLYKDGGVTGLLGIPYGIHNGFFHDFVRINERGELISEESILYSDIPYSSVSSEAPASLVLDRNVVYSYSVCKTASAFRANADFSCLK
jgi:hypothetical protein